MYSSAVYGGGSEGALGISMSEAALLASHGIPALAIAYFDEPGLPCRLQRIPLEHFVKALRWLASQPQVAPGRVWILNGSRGTEAELLIAADWPDIVHGVVAEAPAFDVKGAYPGTCPTTGANGLAPAWTRRSDHRRPAGDRRHLRSPQLPERRPRGARQSLRAVDLRRRRQPRGQRGRPRTRLAGHCPVHHEQLVDLRPFGCLPPTRGAGEFRAQAPQPATVVVSAQRSLGSCGGRNALLARARRRRL